MKQLFTDEELNLAKSNDLLPIECLECGKTFYKTKHYIKSTILSPKYLANGNYCSVICASEKLKNKVIKKTCPKCNKEFETVSGKDEKKFCSSFCAHSRKQTKETKENISKSIKNSEKAKESRIKNFKVRRKISERELIKKECPICKKEFKVLPCKTKKIYCSKECYNNDKNAEFRKCGGGGIREGSGRSKSGWYKGFYCGSSYELAWIIYNIDHKIEFKRNTEGFDYFYEGETHKYYPDFIKEEIYYEIKGFKRKNDDAKFKSFPHKLRVLFKKDLGEIFKYVKETYGSDFVKLYEGNPYNEKKNICKVCGKPAKNDYCSRECSGRAANLRNFSGKQKKMNNCLQCGKETKSKFCSLSCSSTYNGLRYKLLVVK
jgi:hypothetical protein